MAVTMVEQQENYGPPTPVLIFQWEAEYSQLLELYRERKPKRVLEVGTYHGGTLYHWLTNADPGTLVVSVDSYAVGVDNRRLYPGWVPEGVELEIIKGDCAAPKTLAKVREHAPFDWVFIDAGHYYEEVKADWDNYRPMVATGGVVCFHDILPPTETWPSIQVAWLWDEIKQHGYVTEEIVAYPDAAWGGIGIVRIP